MTPFGWVVVGCALAKLALHLATASGYGFFCDELYTIALSKHLEWGYVDVPPHTPALVALSRTLLGDSLFAIHVMPALAGAGTLLLACLVTRELGGRAFAALVTGLAFLATPTWLAVDSIFCYDSLDQLALAGLTYVLARLLRTGNPRLWAVAGLVAGGACLAKLTILLLAPALVVAVLLSRRRRDLAGPWPWLAVLAFLVVVAPYLHWQATHGWPTVAFWRRYQAVHVYRAGPGQYLLNAALSAGIAVFPLLPLGLYRILRPFGSVSFRLLGGFAALGSALLAALHARASMGSELWVPLLAAAAVLLEERVSRLRHPRAAQLGAAACLLAQLAVALPSTVPVLPVRVLPAYASRFGFLYRPLKDMGFETNEYPYLLANRLGWEELVEDVARVYHELPEADRARAGIFADWFGPAGAIDLFGPRHGLPPAVSGHVNYHLWGPGRNGWEVMILVTTNVAPFRSMFEQVEEKRLVYNPFAVPWNRLRIYVARRPRIRIEAEWPTFGPY